MQSMNMRTTKFTYYCTLHCAGPPPLNDSNAVGELCCAWFAAAHWEDLGLELGIEQHDLKTIK